MHFFVIQTMQQCSAASLLKLNLHRQIQIALHVPVFYYSVHKHLQ